MDLIKTSVITNPCKDCPACARRCLDGDGNPIHLGNYFTDGSGNRDPNASGLFPERPEWNLTGDWVTTTFYKYPVTIRVATTSDTEKLLATPSVFPQCEAGQPDFTPCIVREFTDRRGLYHPYICIAIAEGEIVSRLYLDPNPDNAVCKKLNAATIDNVTTASDFEGRGYADKLLEFAENTARNNGFRWLEIGCTKEAPNTAAAHTRRGHDSLSMYLRHGFHKHASILHNPIRIYYQARALPVDPASGKSPATMYAPRYGKAVVVYKDLMSAFEYSVKKRKQMFEELIAKIPD